MIEFKMAKLEQDAADVKKTLAQSTSAERQKDNLGGMGGESKRLDLTAIRRAQQKRDAVSSRHDSGSSKSKPGTDVQSSVYSRTSRLSYASSRHGPAGFTARHAASQFQDKTSSLQDNVSSNMRSTSQRKSHKTAVRSRASRLNATKEQRPEQEASVVERKELHRLRAENIARFRRDFPQFRHLTNN